MKKKTPNIPSETSIATMFAPANEPILKSERSSIGSRWRDSSTMNAASSTAAAAKSPRISADAQPCRLPSISA